MRELQEETDIWLYDPKGLWNKSYNMIDCGIHPHNKEKNIHIICIAIDAPLDSINALTGAIGRIPDITAKVTYAKQ